MTFLGFKGYRQYYGAMRKILRGNEPQLEHQENIVLPRLIWYAFLGLVSWILIALLFISCEHGTAYAYTDEQYVNAIYKAEGGIHAKHPFGISNAKCSTLQACKEICSRTVRNNKKRYTQYGFKRYPRFIQFLGSRYCPTTGRNLTTSEIRLNRFWIDNVSYFLQKDA